MAIVEDLDHNSNNIPGEVVELLELLQDEGDEPRGVSGRGSSAPWNRERNQAWTSFKNKRPASSPDSG